jgi:translation initiation factor IF-1
MAAIFFDNGSHIIGNIPTKRRANLCWILTDPVDGKG